MARLEKRSLWQRIKDVALTDVGVLARGGLDQGSLEQLEELLLESDFGVPATLRLVEAVEKPARLGKIRTEAQFEQALAQEISAILSSGEDRTALQFAPAGTPTVILMVGVNGVGKTTTIGKLASKFQSEGKRVLLAAGDTFRAAAVQQLEVWGKRVGCDVVRGPEGGDPAAVIFEAVKQASRDDVDIVLADTAGRLQTKAPLMDELKKIARTMQKALDGAPHETLLVLDATNGQNAISQAKLFKDALPLTGIVLTKLDGTAKGGVILAICDELQIPVRYVGLGERAEDLRDFDADEFVEALLGQPDNGVVAA